MMRFFLLRTYTYRSKKRSTGHQPLFYKSVLVCYPIGSITYMKLEGSASDHDARIGSDINITCYQKQPEICGCFWKKDGEKLDESKKHPKRIEWIQDEKANANNEENCIVKLAIRNVTSNDTGKYTCIVLSVIENRQPENSLFIYAGEINMGVGFVVKHM